MEKHNNMRLLMVPLMLVLFISTLDQTVVAASLSSIGKALGDANQVTWVTTAYLITSAVTTLIFGKLGDSIGRKLMLQVSLSIFLMGSLLCGLSGNMWLLIASRAFQGIGGGGLATLCMAVVGDLVPPLERSRYQGLIGLVPSVALVAGPFLGGFITDQLSWHWIFFINLPIGIVALAFIASALHLEKRQLSGKIDIWGALVISIATATLLLNLSLGGSRWTWASGQSIGLFATAAVMLAAFILIERQVKSPITPLTFFKSNIFTISTIQFFLVSATMFVFMLFTPMYFQMLRGYSASRAGATVIPLMIGVIVASASLGEFITRTGRYKILPIFASALIAISAVMMGMLGSHTNVWYVVVALFISGLGQGAMIQTVTVAGQNAVPFQHIGAATGALNFFKSLGGSFSSVIFAAILANATDNSQLPAHLAHGFSVTFLWVLPLMAISFILAIFMKEKPLSEEMVKIAAGEAEAPEY
ncbi:MDR family MFS transporter [Lactococcus allomyrinae]|nr:MDR family MFS transporter [Lactococcus allomyrinae]